LLPMRKEKWDNEEEEGNHITAQVKGALINALTREMRNRSDRGEEKSSTNEKKERRRLGRITKTNRGTDPKPKKEKKTLAARPAGKGFQSELGKK